MPQVQTQQRHSLRQLIIILLIGLVIGFYASDYLFFDDKGQPRKRRDCKEWVIRWYDGQGGAGYYGSSDDSPETFDDYNKADKMADDLQNMQANTVFDHKRYRNFIVECRTWNDNDDRER